MDERVTCPSCEGDGFDGKWAGNCARCKGSGKITRPKRRYCMPCDKWVPWRETVCKACGADTDPEAA
jgi:DnaJ-class molecular chaperone